VRWVCHDSLHDLALLEEAETVTSKGHRLRSLYATVGARLYCGFLKGELSEEKTCVWLAGAWIPELSQRQPTPHDLAER
jgi:hypothetical protein